MKRNVILVIVNIFIILAMTAYVLFFSLQQKELSVNEKKKTFINTIGVMENVSSNYLDACQKICNNWALYINSGNYSMENAMKEISFMNSDSDISAQLLDAKTLKGISSVAGPVRKDDYSVEYKPSYNSLYKDLKAYADGKDGSISGNIRITRNFTNPVNGRFVIAFCNTVTLYDNSSKPYRAVLMLINPLDDVMEKWVFPTGYSNAHIAVIDMEGDYIIRSDNLKSENFFEFIRSYNNLTYPQSDDLKKTVSENNNGGLEYIDAAGKENFYVYSHIENSSDWLLIGSIPIESLDGAEIQWSLLAATCAAFVLLICLDGSYIVFMNRRLKASLAVAERANKAKTEFLSSMSHDIRTPMNAISGMTAIAEKSLDDREQLKDCLAKIEMSSNHLLTLINDVLDISRIESGQLKLTNAAMSIPDAVHKLIGIMYSQIEEKKLDFRFITENIFCEYVLADELRINQIWINILSNAVKYTNSQGKITILLSEEKTDSGKILLIFKSTDTGIGMTDEFQKTIFDSFTRASDTRINSVQGTGLGMAITKQLVDLMKGEITVESRLEKGSVFTVKILLEEAENPAAEGYKNISVIVAENNKSNPESTVNAIECGGIKAFGTESCEKALIELGDGKNTDAVFIDENLMGAYGMVGAIKAVRKKAAKPAIFIAAYELDEDVRNLIGAGADGYIEKPLFCADIADKLNEITGSTAEKNKDVIKKFDGICILVAEDNNINWEIVKKLLAFYGINAKRAVNGKVCVEMLRQSDEFAMVFMDIQMPVMNGYEAASEIRALDNKKKSQIPIIAMTADAFSEDIEHCIHVGMNGHISKPINIDKILEVVKKYCSTD